MVTTMTPRDLVLAAELLGLVTSLIGTIWLLLRLAREWDEITSRSLRALMVALWVYSLALLYVTTDYVVADKRAGLPAFVLLFADLNLLYALWVTRGRGFLSETDDTMKANEGDSS